MDQHETVFREEAYELLTELESSLLELENNPADNELISKIFRAMHTIKGSGAMFGFDKVATFTHDIESVYDLLRNGKITANKELITITLSSCDQIRRMIDGTDESDAGEAEKLTLAFKEFLLSAKDKPGNTEPPKAQEEELTPLEPADKKVTYRIRFKPHADIFSRGTNTTPLLTELRRMGVCKLMAQTDAVPELDLLNPESCYIYWDIMLTTNRGINAIKDVFIFVEEIGRASCRERVLRLV
jgi:two-component system chemotaxis sensor kinase CheA